MAFSSNLAASADTGRVPTTSRAPGVLQRFESWRSRRRQIARTMFELGCYSERELADLGLTRDDIAGVARGEYRRS